MYGTPVGVCLPQGIVKTEAAVGVVLVLGIVEVAVGSCVETWKLLASSPLLTGFVLLVLLMTIGRSGR